MDIWLGSEEHQILFESLIMRIQNLKGDTTLLKAQIKQLETAREQNYNNSIEAQEMIFENKNKKIDELKIKVESLSNENKILSSELKKIMDKKKEIKKVFDEIRKK
ncbi:MAG: hypothetical protein ACRC6K_00145 [Fusobacteriaceae bacterium]